MDKYNYDKVLLNAFVSGHKINEYNVEDLKNNNMFMLDAVKFSKSKRVYEMASDKVKNNIDFVVGVIKVFKTEEVFVKKL